jgi:hypothetical protein
MSDNYANVNFPEDAFNYILDMQAEPGTPEFQGEIDGLANWLGVDSQTADSILMDLMSAFDPHDDDMGDDTTGGSSDDAPPPPPPN